jgi:uncharacterized protein (DUF983 family)
VGERHECNYEQSFDQASSAHILGDVVRPAYAGDVPPTGPQPTLRRMLGRGLLRRCPWCGSRRTFIRRWLGKRERCQTCGIRWHREEGIEFGALMLNTAFTFAAIAVAMIIGFVGAGTDVAVVPLISVCFGLAVVVPLIVYPFTFTLWLAIDLAGHRPTEAELAEAASAVSAQPQAAPEVEPR